jgi:signal peptidase II
VGLILALCIGLDQITKRIAEQTLANEPVHSFLFDTFRLQYIQNKGAFLGFGSNFSDVTKLWLFLVLPFVFLIGAALYVIFSRKPTTAQAILVSLIVGGGISNLIDRVLQGSVTDFLNVGIGTLRTGIFNIADMAIMAGAIGLFLLELFLKKTHTATVK